MARIKIHDLDEALSDDQLDSVTGGVTLLQSSTLQLFSKDALAKGCGCMGMPQDPGRFCRFQPWKPRKGLRLYGHASRSGRHEVLTVLLLRLWSSAVAHLGVEVVRT